MAYVAGHKHDLFVSYVHEESDWVKVFLRRLGEEFRVRTGEPLSFWQDSRNLRLGQEFHAEIKEGIQRAAAFLAVISPQYLTSAYCKRERDVLLEKGLENQKAGSFYRLLKVIKTFDSDRRHTRLLPAIHEILFCDKTDGYEFSENSAEFASQARACVRDIRALFRFMNDAKEGVYLAPGHFEMNDGREELKRELKAFGFRVNPDAWLDESFPTDAIREAMEPASMAVFLFGADYDRFTGTQVEIAQELGKPVLFWVQTGKQQDDVLRYLDDLGGPPLTETMVGRSVREFIPQLLDKLRTKRVPERATAESRERLVYVNYDFTDPLDSSRVQPVADVVRARHFEVAQSGREADHDHLMRTANAVLVFRAANPHPDHWLKHNALELVVPAKALQRAVEFDAKALLVSEPERIQSRVPGVPVYPYSESFDPATLNPFLDSLQRAGQP
jgi:hypothetical protein